MHKGKEFEPVPPLAELAAKQVVDAALTVHRKLGPGLMESIYEACLAHELTKRGIRIETQVNRHVMYDGIELDAAYRLDMIVEDCLIVELKAVDALTELHEAQLLTYLKLTGYRLGLLINFNVPVIRKGIKRIVH
jgi:GxxExxY protein